MEFFDSLVIPQSLEHIRLLKSLSVLTLVILLPYLGVLLSSSFLSVIFFQKSRSTKSKLYLKFSKELIDLITVNKSSAIGLGIVPLLSFLFLYSQLLQGSGASIFENIMFILIILLASFISLYIYKYSFGLSKILNLVEINDDLESDGNQDEFDQLKSFSHKLLYNSGILGTILLFLASYLFIGIIQFLNNSGRWDAGNSIADILFSADSFIYYLYYLSAAISLTASFILFRYLTSNYDGTDIYKNYIRSFSLKTMFIFILVQPVLMLVQVSTIADSSLSNSTFVLSGLILLILMVISIFVYFMLRENHLKYRNHLIIMMLLLFGVMILQSQSSFDTTSQLHDKFIEASYATFVDDYKNSLGIETKVPVSGLDIFKAKCSACHSFENKIVGPPYNEVLPQFENNMNGLEDFIASPRKINPAYPAMPNQGLKPDEVKAIAKYLMDTYKENKK